MSELATLRIRERGTLVLASIEGEVDVSNRDTLTARLTEAVSNSVTGLLIDLSELEFLDSSGVHMLYELAERLATRQQRYAVVLPPDRAPRRAVELSGVGTSAWLHGETASAVAALGD